MLTFPSFLAFLLPAPALRDTVGAAYLEHRRRRAVAALRLAPHLLRDVGLDSYQFLADDPRWVRRFDLDR